MIQFEVQARMTGSWASLIFASSTHISTMRPSPKLWQQHLPYVESRDPNAVEIQKDIQKNGYSTKKTVSKYIGRPEDDVVVDRAVNNYKQLQQQADSISYGAPGA
ncbi:hypothetical protein ACVFZR_07205 [Lacticaseibacillus paracasei]